MASGQTKPVNKREEARERTKEELLRAGAELLWKQFADGAADPLRLLSPKQITERASALRGEKLSPGMLYHHWPPPEPVAGETPPDKLAAYGRVLLLRVLELPFDPEGLGKAAMEAVGRAAQAGERIDLQELARAVGKFEFDRYRYSEKPSEEVRKVRFATLMLIFAESALWRAGKAEDGPGEDASELRVAMLSAMRERDPYMRLRDLYAATLDALQLEMADGFRVDDIVEGLWSMLDGFTINSWHFDRVCAERTWRGQDGWSLFSIASFLFVDALTVPTNDGQARRSPTGGGDLSPSPAPKAQSDGAGFSQ